jgi:hypothetical protein
MAILPKAIYILNSIPRSKWHSSKIEKSTLKFIWKHKRPQKGKAILNKRATLEVPNT